jgi:hypothetical protein
LGETLQPGSPFSTKPGLTCSIFTPLSVCRSAAGTVEGQEVVEERKTDSFRTLKPHEVSSSPTVLTGFFGLDFPFDKDAGFALEKPRHD